MFLARLQVIRLPTKSENFNQQFCGGAEQQAYCIKVSGFLSPIDQWLTANSHSPQINTSSDYLMLGDPSSEYIQTCIKLNAGAKHSYPGKIIL